MAKKSNGRKIQALLRHNSMKKWTKKRREY